MMLWDQNLKELFLKGGFAMWPLLLCSVLSLAIIAERALYFARIRLDYESFRKRLRFMLQKNSAAEVQKYCRSHVNPVPRIADRYLKYVDRDEIRDEALARDGSLALEKLEARLRALATITHVAPLLGLLGTVTGLVGAFHQIEIMGGHVQPADLASGIWEALITTVFGLVIAIPCMAAYHGFEGYVDKATREMKFIVTELNEFFAKPQTAHPDREETETSSEEVRGVTAS